MEHSEQANEENMYTGPWWAEQIAAYHRKFKSWINDVNNIERLYEHSDSANDDSSSILASLMSTVEGMLLARSPIPIVEQRFKNDDKMAKIASATLGEALKTSIDNDDDGLDQFGELFLNEFFLYGRATGWLTVEFPVDDNGNRIKDKGGNLLPPNKAPIEFVTTRDFAHNPHIQDQLEFKKRGWVARRKWITPRDLAARFDNKEFLNLSTGFNQDTYEHMQHRDTDSMGEDPHAKDVEVWEIWCPETKKTYHLAYAQSRLLGTEEDYLHLQQFTPAVTAYWKTKPHSLVPIPQYKDAQKIIGEMNDLRTRITEVTGWIAVRGVIADSFQGAADMMDGESGKFVRTNIEGSMDINKAVQVWDITPLTNYLAWLISSLQEREQQLYKNIGIPDIVRGSVHPNEKAKQSEIKAGEAGNRIGTKRAAMARAYRDLLSLKAEIIAEHFSPVVLRRLSGFDSMEMVRNFTVPVEGPQIDPNTGQPQIDPNTGQPIVIEMMQPVPPENLILSVRKFLAIDEYRNYKLIFDTDATVLVDPSTRGKEMMDLINAMGVWGEKIAGVFAAGQTELGEFLSRNFLDAIRKGGVGHAMESHAEEFLTSLHERVLREQQQEQEQEGGPAGPSPEDMEMQFKQQEMQLKFSGMLQSMAQKREEANLKLRQLEQKIAVDQQKGATEIHMMQLRAEHQATQQLIDTLKSFSA